MINKGRESWKRFANTMKNDMLWSKKDTTTQKNLWEGLSFKETQYETPKKYYNNLYAFNDGTWLIFPTMFKTKKGKLRVISIYKIKEVVRELAYFCRFQKQIGVTQKYELVWHMVCFIKDVVKIKDGVFDCNEKNVGVLNRIADSILKSDVSQDTLERLKDTRMFCVEKDRLKRMNKDCKAKVQAKGRKLSNYYQIYKNYDPSKSISQNAIYCGVSPSTIKRYKRDRLGFENIIREYERMVEQDRCCGNTIFK